MVMVVEIAQSCLTVCDPMDCSPPGSSVNEILQAIILKWVACPLPGDHPDPWIEPQFLVSTALAGGFLPIAPPGKPLYTHVHFFLAAKLSYFSQDA